jgi:hypothetical protein
VLTSDLQSGAIAALPPTHTNLEISLLVQSLEHAHVIPRWVRRGSRNMLFLLGIQVVNVHGETILSPLGPSPGIAPEFPGSQPGVLSIGRRPTQIF